MRILYIDIDSLRPDHLGCYGYARPTSPVVDQIAAEGVRFSNYFASDSPCVPSRAALFSARPGIQNGVVAHENTPRGSAMRYGHAQRYGDAPFFMHHLSKAGVHTASFSSFADRHFAGWFHFGFREFHLVSLKGGNEDAHEVNAWVLPWLAQNARREDWFVHLNYWDPHTLYTEPVSYLEQMARHPAPAWPDAATLEAQQALTGIRTPRTLWGMNPHEAFGKSRVPTMPDRIGSRADFEHLINGYDGAIRYLDEHLAQVLEALEQQGVLDETAILISADHGEAFGELGQYMEHGAATPATSRVPLIVRWPGLTDAAAGSARDELLLNVDLAPTVAEALGLDIPAGWAGRSFLPLLGGGRLSEPREHLVFSHGLHTRQRAVLDGRWLFIRTYQPSFYRYEPWMLFDLEADPHLTRDLAEEQPGEVRRLGRLLHDWEQGNMAATGQPDPMRLIQDEVPTVLGAPEDYVARLRGEGRDEDAEGLLEQWSRLETDYAPAPLD
jgi:choline-sulfatase